MIGLAKLHPGNGTLELAERPGPRAKSGYVVLEVRGAGVCGTDLHIERGEYACCPPVTLGHEVSGVVLDADPQDAETWLGSRVVAETYFSTCGLCWACRDGRPNLCADRKSIGSHVDGAFAPRVAVPVHNLHRIPDWLDEHAAALAEPLACVCNSICDPLVVAPGDRVLVTGPGPVGLLAAQVAQSVGAAPVVIGLPTDTARLEVARKLNLEVALAGERVNQFDVAIECSGNAGAAAAALSSLRKGGTYVQVGIFGRDVSLPMDLFLLKEIAFRTGFASTPHSWRRAMSLIESKLVALEPLISAIVPLRNWKAVFSDLRGGRVMKYVFDPRLD